jgi:uncharacterized membrane protein
LEPARARNPFTIFNRLHARADSNSLPNPATRRWLEHRGAETKLIQWHKLYSINGSGEFVAQVSTHETRVASAPDYRKHLPWLVMLVGFAGFLAAPWPLAEKAHAVMHGLCAQIPSHTFILGNQPLPFDARMTGIYSGLAVTMIMVAFRTRLRASALPSAGMLVTLIALVALMAVDGFNSLFLDLGMRYVYEPQNWLRLVTGAGAGTALGVTLCFLTAETLWRQPDHRSRVFIWRDLALTIICWIPIMVAVLSGVAALFPVVTLVLLASAVITVCSIAYMMLVLTRMTNNRHTSYSQLGSEAAAGIVLGFVAIAFLACGRFALERWAGIASPV